MASKGDGRPGNTFLSFCGVGNTFVFPSFRVDNIMLGQQTKSTPGSNSCNCSTAVTVTGSICSGGKREGIYTTLIVLDNRVHDSAGMLTSNVSDLKAQI